MATVVIQFFNRGIEAPSWKEIHDSTTMSGAVRKASASLRETFHVITKVIKNGNYRYWHVEDIADLPETVKARYFTANESAKRAIVDATPFFQGEQRLADRVAEKGW
jgi:hypothetical protein